MNEQVEVQDDDDVPRPINIISVIAASSLAIQALERISEMEPDSAVGKIALKALQQIDNMAE